MTSIKRRIFIRTECARLREVLLYTEFQVSERKKYLNSLVPQNTQRIPIRVHDLID